MRSSLMSFCQKDKGEFAAVMTQAAATEVSDPGIFVIAKDLGVAAAGRQVDQLGAQPGVHEDNHVAASLKLADAYLLALINRFLPCY